MLAEQVGDQGECWLVGCNRGGWESRHAKSSRGRVNWHSTAKPEPARLARLGRGGFLQIQRRLALIVPRVWISFIGQQQLDQILVTLLDCPVQRRLAGTV